MLLQICFLFDERCFMIFRMINPSVPLHNYSETFIVIQLFTQKKNKVKTNRQSTIVFQRNIESHNLTPSRLVFSHLNKSHAYHAGFYNSAACQALIPAFPTLQSLSLAVRCRGVIQQTITLRRQNGGELFCQGDSNIGFTIQMLI